jgi:hypothetical protein
MLWHFPLVPRFQRIFLSKEASKEAQWHKLKWEPSEKEMSHPTDGEVWQAFDREYPDFTDDARNIRLGLATDGFNHFANMNTKYSMWPVLVVPYNLLPWACMEESNFMMTLLIPGPSAQGMDFDVFLEPLVEDLLVLVVRCLIFMLQYYGAFMITQLWAHFLGIRHEDILHVFIVTRTLCHMH